MMLAPSLRLLACAALLLAGCDDGADSPAPANAVATAAPAPTATPLPDIVKVRLETGEGPILLELDARSAPITTVIPAKAGILCLRRRACGTRSRLPPG